MRILDLQEWRPTDKAVPLSVKERDALKPIVASIEPASGERDAYHLTPGSTIGALEIGDLSVSIEPKLPIGRVLYLAAYAMGVDFREERFDYVRQPDLVEALVPALTRAARRAFARGLLHGYRTEEEALQTVRGRIRVADQLRRRFGVPLPVEVRYDDFTDDVLANRLVKAAADRLSRLRIRSRRSRLDLAWVAATLDNVSLVEFPTNSVPEVKFDRLNEHYREVVTLARLILRHTSIETGRGRVRANGFLMDMNVVFQEFVTRALREELAFPNVPSGPTVDCRRSTSIRPIGSGSSPTSPGGTARPAPSSATRSTSGSSTPTCPTPTSTSYSPTPPPSTCPEAFSSTPKAKSTTLCIEFATPGSSSRWRRSTCQAASTT